MLLITYSLLSSFSILPTASSICIFPYYSYFSLLTSFSVLPLRALATDLTLFLFGQGIVGLFFLVVEVVADPEPLFGIPSGS